jgi:hypothetical protein
MVEDSQSVALLQELIVPMKELLLNNLDVSLYASLPVNCSPESVDLSA